MLFMGTGFSSIASTCVAYEKEAGEGLVERMHIIQCVPVRTALLRRSSCSKPAGGAATLALKLMRLPADLTGFTILAFAPLALMAHCRNVLKLT